MDEAKPNPFIFPLEDKNAIKVYYDYLLMYNYCEKIKKLIDLGLIIQEDDGFNLKLKRDDYVIAFIKVWFDLKLQLSAEFLYHSITRCKLYMDLSLMPMFNVDEAWSIIKRYRMIKVKQKGHVITELTNKNLIKRVNTDNYKVYILNMDNYGLSMLVHYINKHILD